MPAILRVEFQGAIIQKHDEFFPVFRQKEKIDHFRIEATRTLQAQLFQIENAKLRRVDASRKDVVAICGYSYSR